MTDTKINGSWVPTYILQEKLNSVHFHKSYVNQNKSHKISYIYFQNRWSDWLLT
jgi:hypothetical protein